MTYFNMIYKQEKKKKKKKKNKKKAPTEGEGSSE